MIKAVYVFTNIEEKDTFVGTARFNLRRGRISTTFSYAIEYLSNPSAYPIDPAFPLRAQQYHADGLPGAFRDSSPDRWGRNLVAKRQKEFALRTHTPLHTLDEVDFLLGAFDQTRQGALRFCAEDGGTFLSPSPGIPPLVQLPQLLHASTRVAQENEGFDELKLLLDAGSGSLGGARPKASVFDGKRLLLAKFSHPGDEWDVMTWEKTMLDLARAAGIRVPKARLVPIGTEKALVMERFDREDSLLEGVRLPYLSAMSLLGSQDGEGHDYVEIAEAASVFVDDAERCLEELFARVAFSIAINNVDDHLRNHGFIKTRQGWELAPAFDINPDPHASSQRTTSIMGALGRDEARGLAAARDDFGLDEDRTRELVCTILNATAAWATVARRNGCSQSELRLFKPVIDRQRTALEEAFVK